MTSCHRKIEIKNINEMFDIMRFKYYFSITSDNP